MQQKLGLSPAHASSAATPTRFGHDVFRIAHATGTCGYVVRSVNDFIGSAVIGMHALSEIGGALWTSGFVQVYLTAAERETVFQIHGMELYLMRRFVCFGWSFKRSDDYLDMAADDLIWRGRRRSRRA
jgi:hypothetical protein